MIWVSPNSQPEGEPHLQTEQHHSRLNYNRSAHISHKSDIPGALSSGDTGDCATEPTRHLQHKTTRASLEVIADRPNTQTQTQTQRAEKMTKKHAPNERTREIPQKRIKQNENKQDTRCRIQNNAYKDV